jgi:transcriptional regulator with XRE-family HTH domain
MKSRRPRTNAELARGQRIEAARFACRLTLANVATQVGVSAKMVDFWEAGFGVPAADMLTRLAGALECSPKYILHGDADVADTIRAKTAARQAEDRERQAARQAEADAKAALARNTYRARMAEARRQAESIRAELAEQRRKAELQKVLRTCWICRQREGDWFLGSKYVCKSCRDD